MIWDGNSAAKVIPCATLCPTLGTLSQKVPNVFFLQYYVLLCFLKKSRKISRYLISKISTNQEPTRIQPGTNQDPTRIQPGTNQDPTRNQPGSNQEPTRNQPGTNQELTRIQPGTNQDCFVYRRSTTKVIYR